jgi:mono/diheme cytochrome c family protein
MGHDHAKAKPVSTDPVCAGVLAEFENAHDVLHAAQRVKDAGYSKWDVYSPFPLHGIDDIMQRPTVLPWNCAVGAFVGLATAILLQWATNGFDYPIIVSGKEPFAFPASMPINFELTVLITAFTCFFSVILLSGLPRLYNPLLRNDRFRQGVTDDKVCIAIDSTDPKFSRAKTADFLRSLHPLAVEEVMAVPESTALPSGFALAAIVLALLAAVPPILIVRKRNTFVDVPRIHPVLDMDFQPKFKPQKVNEFFADKRASRNPITGTIARGDLELDVHYFQGLDSSATVASIKNASYLEPAPGAAPADPNAAAPAGNAPAAGAAPAAPVDNTPYAKDFPPQIIEKLKTDGVKFVKRGQERFNIYCAACHGLEGAGDGLVARRATELEQPTWVKPLSIHDDGVVPQPVGKIYRTISYGIRKMPGYEAQIMPEDRWAIILYMKSLQRSRNAPASDVPPAELEKIQAAK